jgi:hypothetical protein
VLVEFVVFVLLLQYAFVLVGLRFVRELDRLEDPACQFGGMGWRELGWMCVEGTDLTVFDEEVEERLLVKLDGVG